MRLALSVTDSGGALRDVVVDVDTSLPGKSLLEALGEDMPPMRVVRTGARLDSTAAIARFALVQGDVLVGEPAEPLTPARPGATAELPYAEGHLLFNRPPRVQQTNEKRVVDIPTPPEKPKPAKFPLSTALLPAVAGVVMAVVMHMPQFLLFMLMSPIIMLGSRISDRRSGRHDYRRDAADFQARLVNLDAELVSARDSSLAAARQRNPPVEELVARARDRLPRLWERSLSDPDFLCLCAGHADRPRSFDVVVPKAGDPALCAQAERLERMYQAFPNVPVAEPLLQHGVIGIAGDAEGVADVARALLVAAATLHSPRELAVTGMLPEPAAESWEWLKWLPHARSLELPVAGAPATGAGPAHAEALLDTLTQLVSSRLSAAERKMGFAANVFSPHVLCVLHEDVALPRTRLAPLLDWGRKVGVSVLWLGRDSRYLPEQCGAMLDVSHRTLTFPAEGEIIPSITPVTASVGTAMQVARALAPLRDVSEGAGSQVLPAHVSLAELLDLVDPSPELLTQRWSASPQGLTARIGVTADGPLDVDLKRVGPHALVAGTTGAGKSELLQTIVASLAAAYPPTRVTFLLVDYKGGAAFKDAVALPHTAGFVTDLDSHLTLRCLTSLNAELRRRERVLREHNAKDLAELELTDPAAAPPSLLIVIDEFATLVKEVPDFVEGVVDVAQRGRSLGVHLVLATQKPAGVVTDTVRANTNLRLSLRVADELDSTDVIGIPDAARISTRLPGRGYVRTGYSDVDELQAAYAGGNTRVEPGRVLAGPFWFGVPDTTLDALPDRAAAAPGTDGETDLTRLVGAIVSAAAQAGLPPVRRPWLPPLPSLVQLGSLPLPDAANLAVPVGVVDVPAEQLQNPMGLDLDALGHVLVVGASGSGKTTLLRTLATALAFRSGPERLRLYACDFTTGGLRNLEALPHCGGVVTAEDLERVERLVAMLEFEVETRKQRLSRSGAATLPEHNRAVIPGERLADLVVLVDGYGGLRSTFEQIDHGKLLDRVAALAADGQAVGLHFVITAARRGDVPTALASKMTGRLVLRMAEPDDYWALGLPAAAATLASSPPGRGVTADGLEFQVASIARDATGEGQNRVLAGIGKALTDRFGAGQVPPVRLLPEYVPLAQFPALAHMGRSVAPIGLDAATMQPTCVDLTDAPLFLVVGPDRSGRTTALRTIASGICTAAPETQAYLLSPRRNGFDEALPWKTTAVGLKECEKLAAQLADEITARGGMDHSDPMLIVVDDGDDLADGRAATALAVLTRRCRDANARIVVATLTHVALRSFGGWLSDMRKPKRGFVMSPDPLVDSDIFGVPIPRKAARAFPPGRGYLVNRASVRLVQVATVETARHVDARIAR